MGSAVPSNASPDKLTVAVLGTGRMGQIHLAALAKLRDEGLVAGGRRVAVEPVLYGRDPTKVAELAAAYRVGQTSTDLDGIVDAPDVNVVDNCLVNSLHFAPLMRAIKNGKHVFTEKPLTPELPEAEELLAAARAAARSSSASGSSGVSGFSVKTCLPFLMARIKGAKWRECTRQL
ncbi:MAG TPA: Gfo/Idh/MocA family oxidoreductase, partial [Chloroflexota bacterium]|nr:Gfo/Idh/MocA family oxidoreductase [Chloroflexota bacterium]